ncbi:hypothetical protein [Aquibium oceanicum]|uniref:Uncharacterized protein n=1 Tax=Aquibium oceanicum TaxID=1670800 RepID=A0A1L3SXI4_9HYPH|nr:hypothetical protein [Aquibium oceanicum]APH74129.1 hypothetical protein BSQ44_24230 [Aquibium oceanicum]
MSKIYIVTFNHDYDESIHAFRTRQEAIVEIADAFGTTRQDDTPEFWKEVSEQYEAGSWKGAQLAVLDTETLQVTGCEGASL